MGKPLPVQAAQNFYRSLDNQSTLDSTTQLQWLIDSLQRFKQHQALAESINTSMQINIELDVGLHRGGSPTYRLYCEGKFPHSELAAG